MKRVGKIGRINQEARKKIALYCAEHSLSHCELLFPGCMGTFGVAPAHKEKREWYRTRPELLYDRSHFKIACQFCHEILDNRAKTTKKQSDEIFEN